MTRPHHTAATLPSLTPWFPASVKPARVGVYETRWQYGTLAMPNHSQYQHWDGAQWGGWCWTPEGANPAHIGIASSRQTPEWRGLASAPKVSA